MINLPATLDAIAILDKAASHAACHIASAVPFVFVNNAKKRLDKEVNDYLRGTEAK